MKQSTFVNFVAADNLVRPELSEFAPWHFKPTKKQLAEIKKLPKPERQKHMARLDTKWNVYSAVRGLNPKARVSKENPPTRLCGIVADFDMVSDMKTVKKYVMQKDIQLRPNFVETSLSNKVRLVWVFERELLIPSTEFCTSLLEKFLEQFGAPTLLSGFDKNSYKPAQVWTNGGVWLELHNKPLTYEFCFGVMCDVSKKTSLFNNAAIPLEIIAEETAKRFPGRWLGEFKVNDLGVRFWDEKADNPSGCQIKPDGMLCFTGNVPFVKWSEIFGKEWYETQRVLNLGRAGDGVYFDGKNYHELQSNQWVCTSRTDILLRLTGRDLSNRKRKGETQSDAERVLDHIQIHNRVEGAAPLINLPKGLVEVDGYRILNTVNLKPVQPVAGPNAVTNNPEKDFPWIHKFLDGLFANKELKPLDHFLAWLKRPYFNILNHRRLSGQAVFVCGPINNGKTLLCMQIIKPLLGNRISNPIPYLTGDSKFNSELFSTALLAVNDEDGPSSEDARKRMLAKLKGFVVNPTHTCHPKFEKPVIIPWTGRIFVTLNDDPGSVGMLPEVVENTRDKQMFFASQPYKGTFPPKDELEAIIAKELPYFAHWLLNIYQPPKEVLTDDRMGVKSYYDPRILDLAQKQTFASNLAELILLWQNIDAYWADKTEWVGSPTQLLAALQTCNETGTMSRGWSQQKVAKSLTALAKQDRSGVSFSDNTGTRDFVIKKLEESSNKT